MGFEEQEYLNKYLAKRNLPELSDKVDAQKLIDDVRFVLEERRSEIDWKKEMVAVKDGELKSGVKNFLYEIPNVGSISFEIGFTKDMFAQDYIEAEEMNPDIKICYIKVLKVTIQSMKRGLGIGKAFVEKVIEKAKEEGCDCIMGSAENLTGHQYDSMQDHPYYFYQKLGFQADFGNEVEHPDLEVRRRIINGHRKIPMVMYLNKEHK